MNLQPSGILVLPGIGESSYTGEIKRRPLSRRGVISVPTTFGTLAAQDAYTYTDALEFGDAVHNQIQRARIVGEVIVPKGTTLLAAHELLQREIEDACIVLSLCYRQKVSYFEMEYRALGDDRSMRGALYRRRQPVRTKRGRGDELIHSTMLSSKAGLERLIRVLRAAKNGEGMKRAIDFLALSYEADVEVAYFLAFSAMDTMLGPARQYEDSALIPTTKWREIEEQLQQMLVLEQTTLSSRQRAKLQDSFDELIRRLPGLNQVTLAERIKRLCDRMRVKTNDIWPRQVGFSKGIANATRIRNGLFHAARTDDSIFEELIRVQTLAERLMLRKLRWPEKKLWNWHRQLLGRINAE